MTQSRVYTAKNERYVLPDGTQKSIYAVNIEKSSSVENVATLFLDIHKMLRSFHSGGGVADGASSVDFSAPVPAGEIHFVPLFLGQNRKKEWPIPVPTMLEQLPRYGLRLATPYETLWWFRARLLNDQNKRRPEGLESDGVFAFGNCSPHKRALLISQFSCRIMYVLGRRRPDCYPMTSDVAIPYFFSIATVVDVPVVVRANQYVRLYKPVFPKVAP